MRKIWTDGKNWYVRPSLTNSAFQGRLKEHLRKGWLTFRYTSGDVEVYAVNASAPFYEPAPDATQERIKTMVDEAVDLAAEGSWQVLYDCLTSLATQCKQAGIDGSTYNQLVQTIEARAVKATGDETIPLRMRQEMKNRSKPIFVH